MVGTHFHPGWGPILGGKPNFALPVPTGGRCNFNFIPPQLRISQLTIRDFPGLLTNCGSGISPIISRAKRISESPRGLNYTYLGGNFHLVPFPFDYTAGAL